MQDTELAYLAGVLDSDGYITISRAHRNGKAPNGHTWKATYYAPKIGITGTRPAPHELAQSLMGGSISTHQPKDASHRLVHTWCCQGPTAAACLRLVRPYLLVKSQQADLAIELSELITSQFDELKRTTKPPYRIPSGMTAQREHLWEAVGVLNEPRNRRIHFPTMARGIS